MAEQIFYPAYESWDKSIDIGGSLSDSLLLSRRLDGGSAVVKIIFETFAAVLDPAPDKGFLRLWVLDGSAPDAPNLCVSADYNHVRPISDADWADAPTGSIAVDARPVHGLAGAHGTVDIPLTDLSGIRTCPTGFRLFMLDESGVGVTADNSVLFDGFSGHKPELHLFWKVSGKDDDSPNNDSGSGNQGGGGGSDPGDDGGDGDNSNEGQQSQNPDVTKGEQSLPDARPEFALFAHRLSVVDQRPVIEYRASLRRYGLQERAL